DRLRPCQELGLLAPVPPALCAGDAQVLLRLGPALADLAMLVRVVALDLALLLRRRADQCRPLLDRGRPALDLELDDRVDRDPLGDLVADDVDVEGVIAADAE